MDEHARLRSVKRVLFVVLATNVALAATKLGWGYMTSTLGLVADGFHSLLDSAASILGIVGVTLAAEPPDREHQYGHRKFEVLSAMGISLFIFMGAFEVLREAMARLLTENKALPQITWVSFAIAGVSIFLGVLVSRYEATRGRELGSSVLDSDSAHTWSDVAGSIAVFVGLLATRIHPIADTIVAVALGVYLVRVGYKVVMRGIGVVADRAVLDPAEVQKVARDLEGVLGTANIRTRGEEAHTFLDMILLVEPNLTVQAAHDLVDRLEHKLAAAFPGLRDIVIHVEPAGFRPSDEQAIAQVEKK
ncbi:MAG TPA: cation diffusion facilitator family transporter [Planctomycetota bacterium]|nr:cation diffusion facilitator family transporter [Planctomycetota bacterium]